VLTVSASLTVSCAYAAPAALALLYAVTSRPAIDITASTLESQYFVHASTAEKPHSAKASLHHIVSRLLVLNEFNTAAAYVPVSMPSVTSAPR
jgi:hypothetical protein